MRAYRKNTKSWAPWNRITKELGAMEWVLRSESTGFSGIVCVESVRGRVARQIIGQRHLRCRMMITICIPNSVIRRFHFCYYTKMITICIRYDFIITIRRFNLDEVGSSYFVLSDHM